MKVLIVLSVLILNAFALDFTVINNTDSYTLDRIANQTLFAMDSSDLAPSELVIKFSFNNINNMSPRKIIEETLFDIYIDDQRVIPVNTSEAEIKRISKLLNYYNQSSRDVLRAMKIVETELKALLNDSTLLLFSLETTGYGTFGEGNGFAIYDTITGQFIIVNAGYAE